MYNIINLDIEIMLQIKSKISQYFRSFMWFLKNLIILDFLQTIYIQFAFLLSLYGADYAHVCYNECVNRGSKLFSLGAEMKLQMGKK
jgi:hypothetical protein